MGVLIAVVVVVVVLALLGFVLSVRIVKQYEEGVLFRGKRHRSLSEVARKITGNRWSGPLFFGLKAPVGEKHDGTR